MNATQANIVHVAADKQMFTLDETAALLALARWPEVQGRRVSYPLRFNAPNARGSMLSDGDNIVLAAIWERAKLTPPSFPMTESEWENYTRAFDSSEERPDWALGCCIDDDALTHGMLRAAAEEQFMTGLVDAIRNGSITARDPLTHMPCTGIRVLAGQRDLLLSRGDVELFAASAMIEVHMEPGRAAALMRAERIEARCQELRAKGVRDWLKTVASEEGVSESRIKQIRASKRASPS
ncbi:hypothetical protein ACO2Q2_00455 [Dyella sp. KRB-257]|uniref:hypothetical protein n=1 Tax=Dyella sp. KRB-257 TaxID=3400915 RepID=UPI003C06D6DA